MIGREARARDQFCGTRESRKNGREDALFLASDESDFFVGQSIPFSGGWTQATEAPPGACAYTEFCLVFP